MQPRLCWWWFALSSNSSENRCFDTNRCLVLLQTKRSRPAGGRCGRLRSIRSPFVSMHLSRALSRNLCAIKSQPANVISLPTNFRARHLENRSLATRRRSLLDFPPSSSLLLFFSRCNAPEREGIANEPTALAGRRKKTSARLGSCMQMRAGERTPEFRWEAFRCASSRAMRRENVSLARYASPEAWLFDFR